MKHATIIPLIGGMTLANKKITGKDPEVILSYSPYSPINSVLPCIKVVLFIIITSDGLISTAILYSGKHK